MIRLVLKIKSKQLNEISQEKASLEEELQAKRCQEERFRTLLSGKDKQLDETTREKRSLEEELEKKKTEVENYKIALSSKDIQLNNALTKCREPEQTAAAAAAKTVNFDMNESRLKKPAQKRKIDDSSSSSVMASSSKMPITRSYQSNTSQTTSQTSIQELMPPSTQFPAVKTQRNKIETNNNRSNEESEKEETQGAMECSPILVKVSQQEQSPSPSPSPVTSKQAELSRDISSKIKKIDLFDTTTESNSDEPTSSLDIIYSPVSFFYFIFTCYKKSHQAPTTALTN